MRQLAKTSYMSLMVLALVMAFNCWGSADVATFDDITTGSWVPVPNGYGGLDWSSFTVVKKDLFPGTGVERGVVSGDSAVYNATYGSARSAPLGGLMHFRGCYLTSAWTPYMQVRIRGWDRDVLLYDKLVTITDAEPTWVECDFKGIDRVWFIPVYGGSVFMMDDFTYNLQPSAEMYDFDEGSWAFWLKDGDGNWAYITELDGHLLFTNSKNGNIKLSLHATVPNNSGNATRYPLTDGGTLYINFSDIFGNHRWVTTKWHQTVNTNGGLALTASFDDDDQLY